MALHRRELPHRLPRSQASFCSVTRVLSCIQPTGVVHLGNHLGALRNWVSGQHEADVFHGIVDLHALTVTDTPGVLGRQTLELAAMLFAVGLDPDIATVFVQSHIHEHSELAWIMECTVSFGELSRMTQFKDKSAKREADFVSAGLFTYPALQAADIMLYDANEVPVGDDQRQHIEITRDIAIRFNHRFGETLVVPKAVHPAAGARVMDLQDPLAKMSKSASSDLGIVYLTDDNASIEKKFKRAVTDSDGVVRFDRDSKPGVSNLLEILAVRSRPTPVPPSSLSSSQFESDTTNFSKTQQSLHVFSVREMIVPVKWLHKHLPVFTRQSGYFRELERRSLTTVRRCRHV